MYIIFFRIIIALLLYILHTPNCSKWEWLLYIGVMVAINFLSVGFAFCGAILSARGSILEMGKRRHVATLIYCRVPLFLAEFGWTVISTLIIFGRCLYKTLIKE